jgi:hypothetical protein
MNGANPFFDGFAKKAKISIDNTFMLGYTNIISS